ncbi:DUF924 family protein [Lentilitoribacter sp. EG35]|jgi:uncharacterized protein (DUF924 family)|uniref:DUF924 family protein n=1 Tax=Lentilitoribacter sp. EG35 TaxID=3234192 RepID=UPI00345FE8F7
MVPENWHNDVLSFWFSELTPKQWYISDDDLDKLIKQRFGLILAELSDQLPDDIMQNANKCLAAILCFDQFTRNIYRGSGKAFAQDEKALKLSQHIIDQGWDKTMGPMHQQFVYMPFMHAEDIEMAKISLEFFSLMGEEAIKAAQDHFNIIEKFGRYPHRNEVVGRFSSPEEIEYLKNAQRFGQ